VGTRWAKVCGSGLDGGARVLRLGQQPYDLDARRPFEFGPPRLDVDRNSLRAALARFGVSSDELEHYGAVIDDKTLLMASVETDGAVTISRLTTHPDGGGRVATLVGLGAASGIALLPDGRAQWLGGRGGHELLQSPYVGCVLGTQLVSVEYCRSKVAPPGTLEALAVEASATHKRPSPR